MRWNVRHIPPSVETAVFPFVFLSRDVVFSSLISSGVKSTTGEWDEEGGEREVGQIGVW